MSSRARDEREEAAARRRLDELIRRTPGESYASVSALIGKNHAYIQQYVRRGRPRILPERDRRLIARHFGVAEAELGGPAIPACSGFSEDPGGLVFIPYGGCGGENRPRIPFRRDCLAELGASAAESLRLFRVSGDAMHPTLSHGDEVLFDTTQARLHGEALYVLGGPCPEVRRLSVNPVTGRITVRADNPLYETWRDIDPAGLEILGRVVWAGKRL